MSHLRLLILAAVVALVPLSWWWLSQRGASRPARLAALTALILFLTFDLIVFGAFTRLTDSGLGCPDWPGCYGHASPVGAQADIHAAQTAMPTGPVTAAKAWIEMIHRYLAMAVGGLILVAAGVAWRDRQQLPHSPWWATVTLVWVIVQGLFGKYTVTLKLYPAIVTLHLLGAMVLLLLLVMQHVSFRPPPGWAAPDRLLARRAAWVLALVMAQAALGGWVSTNYAVLACSGFPSCSGQWWPEMDLTAGFTVLRELGRDAQGGYLPFAALVAIHWVHRLFAMVVAVAVLALAAALMKRAALQRQGRWLVLLVVCQIITGVSNVVLGWPIVAALAHTAGAAALVGVLGSLWAASRVLQAPGQALSAR